MPSGRGYQRKSGPGTLGSTAVLRQPLVHEWVSVSHGGQNPTGITSEGSSCCLRNKGVWQDKLDEISNGILISSDLESVKDYFERQQSWKLHDLYSSQFLAFLKPNTTYHNVPGLPIDGVFLIQVSTYHTYLSFLGSTSHQGRATLWKESYMKYSVYRMIEEQRRPGRYSHSL